MEVGIKMDALEMLKEDHQKVADLFEELDSKEEMGKMKRLFDQIKKELETHTYIEENVFYPAMERHEELRDLVKEAYEEHRQVKALLGAISGLTRDRDKFYAKMKVLKDSVEHHVEEEEDELFPKVEDIYDDEQLELLGQELAAAKKDGRRRSTTTSRR
jgi:hemerythrin superfamily protein